MNTTSKDKMNSILCAIDFSDASVRSLRCAFNMSDKLGIPLEILYTYRLATPGEDMGILEYKRMIEQDAKQKFSAIEHELKSSYKVKYTFHIEVGFLPDRIKARLKTMPYRLLIISNVMADTFLSGGLYNSCHDLIEDLKLSVLFHT